MHGILQQRGAKQVVKSKSMLTEECGLNPYLEQRGLEVVDTDLGERIVAWIVTREGEAPSQDELAGHVADLLTPHKRPRVVHFLDELPRNEMGKVQKKKLTA